MSPPRVSIVLPTWNGAAFVAETLATALGQTFADLEVVVADDASDDATLEVASACRDARMRVLPAETRLGIPGHWNRGLAQARGEYVMLLCQDDLLAPTALERLASALDAAPASPLAFCRREIRHEGFEAPPLLQGDTYACALRGFYASFTGQVTGLQMVSAVLAGGRDPTVNLVGEPSFVLMRSEPLRRCGGFDPGLRQLVDWDLWLRLARLGPLVFVDESLGVFRVHPRGASALNHRRLRTRLEFLRILARIRRDYGPELTQEGRRSLSREEWRCRRHLLGGVLGLS